MAQAAFGGIELHYETTGRGEPVVFIHGALIADAFRPLFGQPALSGYRLIAYRRRAYAGSSTSEGVLSVSQQAAEGDKDKGDKAERNGK